MSDNSSTSRGRELGRELRRIRDETGYTGHDMAVRLGWSDSKVSRIENGKRGTTEVDVAIYLAFCGVVGEIMDDLLALARETDNGYRLRPHDEKLPDELRSLIVNETTATLLDSYQLTFVPGLTQTEDYARAVFHEVGLFPEEGIELRVHARMQRQSLLKRLEPPRCTFLIHEDALRTTVGSTAIMHEQMLHLLFLSNRPQCSIRVVPRSAGARGRTSAPFLFLTDAEGNRVAIVESELVSVFLDSPPTISGYQTMLSRLAGVALNEGQSREFLAGLASEYDRLE